MFIVWENVDNCTATALSHGSGKITQRLIDPKSSDIIEFREGECYSGREGESSV